MIDTSLCVLARREPHTHAAEALCPASILADRAASQK